MGRRASVLRGAVLLAVLGSAWTVQGQKVGASGVRSIEPDSRNWALLMGVNAYADIRPLFYCVPDMESLRDKLVDAGFPAENVFLLTDAAPELKYKPTKNNIFRQLDLVVRNAQPNDCLVVAFSGHGVQMGDVSYLCPADANFTKTSETLIPLNRVYELMALCKAKTKLFLVDACRNDPFKPGDRAGEDLLRNGGVRGFVPDADGLPGGIALLSSCTTGQQSWEDKDLGHGVFMNYLLKGLEGAADTNRDTKIGLLELYQFSEGKTRAHVLRSQNEVQVPSLRGDFSSDPVIAMAPKRISGPVDARPREEAKTTSALPPAESENSVVKALVQQGNNFFATGEYDKALQAYTNAINIEPQNRSVYVKRCATHRAKGDLKMAVADYQASWQTLVLTVTEASSRLQDGQSATATVRQGQSLGITRIQNLGGIDWLWVASVDGNDAARGWIQMKAVEKKAVAAVPAVSSTPSAAIARPSTPSGYGNSRYYDYDDEPATPGQRAAETQLNRLYDRYDRNPTRATERQIEARERAMDRRGW
jgi:uncharacterized caspase-like protein